MTVPMVQAVVKGYEDRLFDQQIPAILAGYYSAYYVGSKHPRSPDKIISGLQSSRNKKRRDTEEEMAAKVAQFQEREERLRRFLDGRK